jgi:outer membrane protein OmpA-like peptidoglycan-associated protein
MMKYFFSIMQLICTHGLIVYFLFFTAISSLAGQVTHDVKNSHDSPLLSRYDGSYIIGYEKKEYGDFLLLLSAPKAWNEVPEKKITVEGKHTRIIYVAPKDRSTLEVFRNYQQELKNRNFEVLFSCQKEECGKKEGLVMVRQLLYPQNNKLKNMGQLTEMVFSSPVDMRYLSAKVTGDVNAYVSIFIAKETFKHFEQTYSRAIILLDIIEMKAMESKMVIVPAQKMAEEINETGSFSLYGIYFDTDSSVIKAESQSTLNEIEKLILQNAEMKLYIVGHTDNVGEFDYNMKLSQKRGSAVMEALLKNHSIDPERIEAYGVGMLSPKATNDTPKGSQKNRRVELVKQ